MFAVVSLYGMTVASGWCDVASRLPVCRHCTVARA